MSKETLEYLLFKNIEQITKRIDENSNTFKEADENLIKYLSELKLGFNEEDLMCESTEDDDFYNLDKITEELINSYELPEKVKNDFKEYVNNGFNERNPDLFNLTSNYLSLKTAEYFSIIKEIRNNLNEEIKLIKEVQTATEITYKEELLQNKKAKEAEKLIKYLSITDENITTSEIATKLKRRLLNINNLKGFKKAFKVNNDLSMIIDHVPEYLKNKKALNKYKISIRKYTSTIVRIKEDINHVHSFLKAIVDLKNKDIDKEIGVVDKYLIQALNGHVPLSSTKKTIEKKKIEKIEKISKPKVIKQILKQKYKPKTYNSKDIKFLTERGFKNKKAKEIIDKNNFKSYKSKISALETTLKNAELDKKDIKKQAKIIYKLPNNPLFNLENGEIQEYLHLVKDVIRSNPRVTGMLPEYCKRSYQTLKEIKKLSEDNKDTKITVKGLDIILKGGPPSEKEQRQKYAEDIDNRLRSKRYRIGEPIVDRPINSLKNACYSSFGIGKYRKITFGHRSRAIIKIIPNKKKTNDFQIMAYFPTHQEYDKWWKAF